MKIKPIVYSLLPLAVLPAANAAIISWTGADATNPKYWDIATTPNWSGTGTYTDGDDVTFDDSGVVGDIDLQTSVATSSVTFDHSAGTYLLDDLATNAQTLSASNGIFVTGAGNVAFYLKVTGNTDITHSGTGQLRLGGGGVTMDYIGDMTVDGGGTLRADANGFLGNTSNTISISNGSTFLFSGARNFSSYGAGSFMFADGTTVSNVGGTANSAFDDEIALAGDFTIDGTGRLDIKGPIAVSGTDITITIENNTGSVISGDNSAQSIAEWVVNDGKLFVSNDNALGDNAIVTVNSEGALRGNIVGGGTRTIANDITLNGGRIESAYQDSDTMLTGTLTVAGSGSRLYASPDDGDDRVIRLAGDVVGSSDLDIDSGTVQFESTYDDTGFSGDYRLAETTTARRDVVLRFADGSAVTQDLVVTDTGDNKILQVNAANADAIVSGGITINETGANNFDLLVNEASSSLTLSGVISGGGAAGLEKRGAGTAILSNDNTYTGATTVSAGTLQVDGSLASAVTVASGATLTGSGTFNGAVTVGGSLNPGNSPGTMVFTDDLTLLGTATTTLEFAGTGAGEFDVFLGDNANTLTAAGILNLTIVGYTATLGDTFLVFDDWSSITGSFSSITGTDLGGGLSFDTSDLYTSGVLEVVPEPSAYALLAGMLALGSVMTRRRRA